MTTKLTISVPDEVAGAARDAVRAGQAESVSAYFAAAVDHYRGSPTLDEWLDRADQELGAPPADTVAWAESVLGGSDRARRSA